MIIYKAVCSVNGKIYVGQTVCSLEKRISEHKNDKRTMNRIFPRAIHKYGIGSFVFSVIDSANTIKELDDKEIFWIEKLGSRYPNGYNLAGGGEGLFGFKHSESTKSKMSAAAKGKKNHNFGVPRPKEENEKRSKSLKNFYADGTKTTWMKGRKGFLCPVFGKIVSEETRRKMSVSKKGKNTGINNPMYGKPSPLKGIKQSPELVEKRMAARRIFYAKKRGEVYAACN